MSGRHATQPRRYVAYLAVAGVLGLSVALLVRVVTSSASHPTAHGAPSATARAGAAASLAAAPSAAASLAAGSVAAKSVAPSPARPSPAGASTTGRSVAASSPSAVTPSATGIPTTPVAPPAALSKLIAQAPNGGVSVAAYNTRTGRILTAGAASGMTTASVIKVELLATLLLEHQKSHSTLSSDEDAEATTMIENSNNDAANEIYGDDGGRSAIVAHEQALGLSRTKTVPGSGIYWGLTTTSASQQLMVLHDLVDDDSPLDAASRRYELHLMRNVESDQQWGVPSFADADTNPAVKNGWLSVDDDGGLWAVNSDGILTVHGQRLLVSVMTQHDPDYDGGIALVEQLAKVAVTAVT